MIIEDPSAPPAVGYTESKYIAERLLAHAAKKLNINVQLARIGTVCGAIRSPGQWNSVEWIPNLVLSSIHTEVIPETLGAYDVSDQDIDWVPVDILAESLVEIGMQQEQRPESGDKLIVYQLANPRRTSWSDLIPGIVEAVKTLNTEGGNDENTASVIADGVTG